MVLNASQSIESFTLQQISSSEDSSSSWQLVTNPMNLNPNPPVFLNGTTTIVKVRTYFTQFNCSICQIMNAYVLF